MENLIVSPAVAKVLWTLLYIECGVLALIVGYIGLRTWQVQSRLDKAERSLLDKVEREIDLRG